MYKYQEEKGLYIINVSNILASIEIDIICINNCIVVFFLKLFQKDKSNKYLTDSLWHPISIPSGFFLLSFTHISTVCFSGARSSNRIPLTLVLALGLATNSAHNLSAARLEKPFWCLFPNERAWLAFKYSLFHTPGSTAKSSVLLPFEELTMARLTESKEVLRGRNNRWLLSALKRLRQIIFWFVIS